MPKNKYCVAGVLAAAMFLMNSDKAGLSVNAAVVKNASLDSDEASEEKNTKTTRITLDYDQVFMEVNRRKAFCLATVIKVFLLAVICIF
ncbi:MAG TPA: hypothetical protein IAA05_13460 [Candidatus Blautia excrementipullorum]|nr:hypothetical protein [Candidatus Blautia excrementipullorum]